MAKKIEKCIACNGSGYYDNNGSPKCSSCGGLGIERGKMPYRLWKHIIMKYFDKGIWEIEAVYERHRLEGYRY